MTVKITDKDGVYYVGNVVTSTYAIEQGLINRGKAVLLDRDNYDDSEFTLGASGSVTGMVGPDGIRLPFDTGKSVTAGLNGDYATLQEAINAVIPLVHFNTSTFAGTATATQGSKLVTGVGTSFIGTDGSDALMPQYIDFNGSGKFYPIKHIVSDTVVYLVSPFAEDTVSGAVVRRGNPVMHTIEIISNVTGNQDIQINISSDGLPPAVTPNTSVDICLTLICLPGVFVDVTIDFNIRSGILIFDGFTNKGREQHPIFKSTPQYVLDTRIHRVADIIYRNLHIEARNHQDIIWHLNFQGRVYLIDSFLSGHWDIFMPKASGEVYCINSTLKSISRNGSNAETSQALTSIFSRSGAFLYAKNSTFWVLCANNSAANSSTCVNLTATTDLGALLSGCTFIFDDCTFVGEKPPGAVETNTTFSVFNMAVNDSDIYISGVCRFIGAPTIQASWRNIAAGSATIANRFYIAPGTKMFPGMTSDIATAIIKTDLALPSAITPGASPYTYINNVSCFTEDIIVTGGTVSVIAISRDGTNFFNVGSVAGMFTLNPGDSLRITYSAVPTVTKITR